MKIDEVTEIIAREICRQSSTSLYGRWSSDPKENQSFFRRAGQILDLKVAEEECPECEGGGRG
ncbi:hypothetical protein LCGC14_2466910, partial [marine sediment metagenome]